MALLASLVLIPLLFGMIEYGRAMYQYNELAKAVRSGARYLSQYKAGDAPSIAAAKCLVAFGSTSCQGLALLPGLTTSLVYVDDASNDPTLSKQAVTANGVTVGVANLVRVSVGKSGGNLFKFTSMGSFLVGDFYFEPISVTMLQALT